MIENQCFSEHKLLLLGQFLTKLFVFFLSLDVEYFSGANELNETCRWKFSEIKNLLETYYRDNHKNMVFYLH